MKRFLILPILSTLVLAPLILAVNITPAYSGSSWSVGFGFSGGYGGYYGHHGHYRYSSHWYPSVYLGYHYSPSYLYYPRYYSRPYVTEVVYERPVYTTSRSVVYEEPVTTYKRMTYVKSEPRVIKKTTTIKESPVTRSAEVAPYRSVSASSGRPVYTRYLESGIPNKDALSIVENELRSAGIKYSRSPKLEVGSETVRPDIAILGAHGKPAAVIEYWSEEDVRAGEARLHLLERLSRDGNTRVYFIEAGSRTMVSNESTRLAREILAPPREARPVSAEIEPFSTLEPGQ